MAKNKNRYQPQVTAPVVEEPVVETVTPEVTPATPLEPIVPQAEASEPDPHAHLPARTRAEMEAGRKALANHHR